MDLSAAFDLVSPSLLIQKLKVYGFDDSSAAWVLSYQTDIYQSVWIDHIYSEFLPNNIGVPQGSNLGPLFFLIFFNDLPMFLKENVDCYADDSTLGATGKSIEDIGNRLTEDCRSLSDWMACNKFKLNAEKTHFLVVGTSRRLGALNEQLEVVMDGVTLKESEDQVETLLGIKIKCDLEWTMQVKVLVDKLKKRLGGLAYLRNIMSVSDKKSIIEGIFNSVLCYCLPLFGGSSNNDLKALQMQQNKAARIALCLPPRSNRGNMYDKLKWLTVLQLVVLPSSASTSTSTST